MSVCMGAQEMRQTSSQGCKKRPRAFPQTHNKTHDSVLSVFLPRHVEVKGQIYGFIPDNKQSHLSAVESCHSCLWAKVNSGSLKA